MDGVRGTRLVKANDLVSLQPHGHVESEEGFRSGELVGFLNLSVGGQPVSRALLSKDVASYIEEMTKDELPGEFEKLTAAWPDVSWGTDLT